MKSSLSAALMLLLTFTPGGACNVAANLATLGGEVEVYGVVGEDDAGRRLTAGNEDDHRRADQPGEGEELPGLERVSRGFGAHRRDGR